MSIDARVTSTTRQSVETAASGRSGSRTRAPHVSTTSNTLRVLIAAEGSGGHVIPALEVAYALAAGAAHVRVLCAQRPQTEGLFRAVFGAARQHGIAIEAVPLAGLPAAARRGGPLSAGARQLWRASRAWQTWRVAQRELRSLRPHVVVGFGGAFSVPVVVAARLRRVPVLLHEQNVTLGRANRWLLRWADHVAVSFDATRAQAGGRACLVTGLPVRPSIGRAERAQAAAQFGLDASLPTLLVLGGSQGSEAINRLVGDMAVLLSRAERALWQVIHLAGGRDLAVVEQRYRDAGLRRLWLGSHLDDMAAAYAAADLAIARAGASTMAELAACGVASILIPYPYAHSHQRANARLAESVGGALHIDEASATPQRLLHVVRRLFSQPGLRQTMGTQVRTLARPDATAQLAHAIRQLARSSHTLPTQQVNSGA